MRPSGGMRVLDAKQLTRGETGGLLIDAQLEDRALRPRAHEPGLVPRHGGPEDGGGRLALQVLYPWARDKAAVRTRGEPLEVAPGDIAEKIHCLRARELVGAEGAKTGDQEKEGWAKEAHSEKKMGLR